MYLINGMIVITIYIICYAACDVHYTENPSCQYVCSRTVWEEHGQCSYTYS